MFLVGLTPSPQILRLYSSKLFIDIYYGLPSHYSGNFRIYFSLEYC
jgi:hypothetical protein